MPDDVNPSDAAGQQDGGAAGTPPPVTSPGQGSPEQSTAEPWETRYNGAMRVLSQRDKQIQDLQDKLAAATASVEELTKQLETLQGSAAAKEQNLGEQIATLTAARDEAQKELTTARADLLKFNALKEHPDLLPLADAIPALPDEAAMAEYLKMMAQGVTEIANTKAKQLTAGMTPGAVAPTNQPKYNYATLADWQVALHSAAGKEHFPEISAAFRKWEQQQN